MISATFPYEKKHRETALKTKKLDSEEGSLGEEDTAAYMADSHILSIKLDLY